MRFFLCLLLLGFCPLLRANEPFLKPDDVVALVGGEDMVVAAELGILESHLHMWFPNARIKVRSLAWEGDTVFEQRRDLNYPTLEQQLEKIGATVVVVQFGAMERKGRMDEFQKAYQQLLARLKGSQMRRVAVVAPTPVLEVPEVPRRVPKDDEFTAAAREHCQGEQMLWVDPFRWTPNLSGTGRAVKLETRDGIHLTERSQDAFARLFVQILNGDSRKLAELAKQRIARGLDEANVQRRRQQWEQFRQAVVEKNRLWFNYSRPQNWAFLAGDRTNQPSSRDHIDRNKRWFPEELEKFVPLIEAKEKEIWELAAKLNP